MKEIRIKMIDPVRKSIDDMIKWIKLEKWETGKNSYYFVWDEKNPDYVIYSPWVYVKRELFKELIEFHKRGAICICYSSEAVFPDMNLCDYAVVFDRDTAVSDRIIRIPTILHYGKIEQLLKVRENADDILQKKDSFCNFIYSNGNAHPMRDSLYYEISKYKKVDSLGKHLNNVGNISDRRNKNWENNSIDMKSRYKFSIAAENAEYSGYVSEKIMTSFYANTVPIYWGDESIEKDFNKEAFINVRDYSNLKELVEYIQFVDSNEYIWKKYISAPYLTDNQLKQNTLDTNLYFEFWDNIFSQPKNKAKRVGKGTWETHYFSWSGCNTKRITTRALLDEVHNIYYKVQHIMKDKKQVH